MEPARLIDAVLGGASFDKLMYAVQTDRVRVSSLDDDHVEFLDEMLLQVKEAVARLEEAIKSDDMVALREVAAALKERFQMLEDSCDAS